MSENNLDSYTEVYIKKHIPVMYRNADYNNIDKKIIDFYTNDKVFLWMHGKPGTGKTHSVYALVKYIIENIDLRYNDINMKIFKEYDINFDTDFNYDIIAIDDFGLSQNNNRNNVLTDIYFSLIDNRLENNKKMIITSNLSVSECIDKMNSSNNEASARIASRLSKVSSIIETKGSDKRKNK